MPTDVRVRKTFTKLFSLLTQRTSPVAQMKPNRPHIVTSSRNYITLGWDSCDLLILKAIEKGPEIHEAEETEEPHKRWYILQRKDRVLGWCTAYNGFKTQSDIGPLAPGDYYEFRLKAATRREESDWSDTLFAATRDDVIPAAQLHRVVENGPVTTLRKLLSQRPTAVEIPNKQGLTPLRLAILKNNINYMGILLNHGADVADAETGSGRTPLMMAAYRGQLEAVQLLLEKGSDWNTRDRNGLTALNYAVDNSHLDIVQLAVEEGSDLRSRDKFGWTPFMRGVILKSSLDVLSYLLDNGADYNDLDDRRQTVLMQAVLSNRPKVVELLLQKGADVGVRNVFGRSAYDLAKVSTNEGIQKLVHLLGSDIEEDSSKNKKSKPKESTPVQS